MRHHRVAALAASFNARQLLDIGCSLGLLTQQLAPLASQVVAIDLSPTAVQRARERIRGHGLRQVQFLAGRSPELPLRAEVFDLVVASDGLYSWDLEPEARAIALREISRVVSSEGGVIFTEHLRPSRFGDFVGEITKGGFRVESVSYLHDRPSYQLESWLKAVRHWQVSRAIRRSVRLARALSGIGRVFGKRGSRHICVIARKARSFGGGRLL